MAGRILNFDKIITETVTVNVAGGPTWELRDDVPAGVMAVAFRVFDLERQLGTATDEPVETQARLMDEHEAATLDSVTAIVQHSYPEVTREQVAEALAPSAQGQVLAVFFPLLLRRFGPPSPSSASDAPRRSESAAPAPAASAPALATGSRQRATVGATTGATRSRRR